MTEPGLDSVSSKVDAITLFFASENNNVSHAARFLLTTTNITTENVAAITDALGKLRPFLQGPDATQSEQTDEGTAPSEFQDKLTNSILEIFATVAQNLYLSIQKAIIGGQIEAAATLLKLLKQLPNTEQELEKIQRMYHLVQNLREKQNGQLPLDPQALSKLAHEYPGEVPAIETTLNFTSRISNELATLLSLAENSQAITEIADLLAQTTQLNEAKSEISSRLLIQVNAVINYCVMLSHRVQDFTQSISSPEFVDVRLHQDDFDLWLNQLDAVQKYVTNKYSQLKTLRSQLETELSKATLAISQNKQKLAEQNKKWGRKILGGNEIKKLDHEISEGEIDLAAANYKISQIEKFSAENNIDAMLQWLTIFKQTVREATTFLVADTTTA